MRPVSTDNTASSAYYGRILLVGEAGARDFGYELLGGPNRTGGRGIESLPAEIKVVADSVCIQTGRGHEFKVVDGTHPVSLIARAESVDD